jgi:hypothetical protein
MPMSFCAIETTRAMTPRLWPEIEKALRDSRFFILLADPVPPRGRAAAGDEHTGAFQYEPLRGR